MVMPRRLGMTARTRKRKKERKKEKSSTSISLDDYDVTLHFVFTLSNEDGMDGQK